MKRTSAPLTLMMPAAPKPWMTRARISSGSEFDSAQNRDAMVKTTSPQRYTLR